MATQYTNKPRKKREADEHNTGDFWYWGRSWGWQDHRERPWREDLDGGPLLESTSHGRSKSLKNIYIMQMSIVQIPEKYLTKMYRISRTSEHNTE